MIFLRLVSGLLVASFAVVALAACGGKDDAPRNDDIGYAALVAHVALLETGDLKGDWKLFATDNFRNDDSTLPDNGNCTAARTLAADMSKANVSRAQRALQLEIAGSTSRAQVEEHVRVFDKASTANEFLKRHRTLMTGDGYIRCLGDGFLQLFGPNARVRFGDAHGRAPLNGVTAAFAQDFRYDNDIAMLQTDSFAWVQDRLFVQVLITGPRSGDSNDVVKEALEKAVAKTDAALKVKDPRNQKK